MLDQQLHDNAAAMTNGIPIPELSEEENKAAMEAIADHAELYGNVSDEYVVRGAVMRCRCGTHQRKLNLPLSHGAYYDEHPLIHALDCRSGDDQNIPTLGICKTGTIGKYVPNLADITLQKEVLDEYGLATGKTKGALKGPPCIPKIIGAWMSTHPETEIVANDSSIDVRYEAVVLHSFLTCKYGGMIEFRTSGQENTDTTPIGGWSEPEIDQSVGGDWLPEKIYLDGDSEQEKYLARRLSNFEIPWDQNKIDVLWEACSEIDKTYGIQVDPRFLLAVIIQEGTGSFNTSSSNRAADGQHGIEVDFALDVMKANRLIFGKFLGYAYYGNSFRSAVTENAVVLSSNSGEVFDYANWQTPIIDLKNNTVWTGIYAGHTLWGKGVKSIYEDLVYTGAGNEYSKYIADIDASLVQEIAKGIVLPEYSFVAEQNGEDSKGVLDNTWTIIGIKR